MDAKSKNYENMSYKAMMRNSNYKELSPAKNETYSRVDFQ
jgi:hypothetical protein